MPRNPQKKAAETAAQEPIQEIVKKAKTFSMKDARVKVAECATQAVKAYILNYGCGDMDADLTLADVFDAERRKGALSWWVEGLALNKGQLQSMIVTMVAQGEYLPALCDIPGMPNLMTVLDWMAVYSDFAYWMKKAEAAQAMRFSYETLLIADGATASDSFLAKLRIDTRSKMAGFLDAKRWSPKQMVELSIQDEVSEAQLQAQVESMLLSNADRYMQTLNILVCRKNELPKLVLKMAGWLREHGVIVEKDASYVDNTFSMDLFKEKE